MLVCSISWEHSRPIVDGNESLEPLPVTAVGGANVRNNAQILKHLHISLDGAGILPESADQAADRHFHLSVVHR